MGIERGHRFFSAKEMVVQTVFLLVNPDGAKWKSENCLINEVRFWSAKGLSEPWKHQLVFKGCKEDMRFTSLHTAAPTQKASNVMCVLNMNSLP